MRAGLEGRLRRIRYAGGDLAGWAAALAGGMGSEFRRPLGISIVGGLLVSQALTLYTTPVVYLYLDRLRLWFARRRAAVGRRVSNGFGRRDPDVARSA